MPEIRKLLVASTCHIAGPTRRLLETTPVLQWPIAGGRYGDNGWFFYAHEENAGEGEYEIPHDLFSLMQRARSLGCDNLLLDSGAEQLEGFGDFTWSW